MQGTLSHLAAGSSIALVLFAVMSLMTRVKAATIEVEARDAARRLNATAWTLIAMSALIYRPVHTLWLLGRPAAHIVSRTTDLIAATMATVAFILLIAARGLFRGLSPRRVKRGVLVNLAVSVMIVGATWLTR